MPQSETAPSAPSAASTTPLPDPISSASAPRTHAALARSTWIRAEVYSLGRKAAAGAQPSMYNLGFDIKVLERQRRGQIIGDAVTGCQSDACLWARRAELIAASLLTSSRATVSSGNSASTS